MSRPFTVERPNNILLIRKQMEDYFKSNEYFPENLIENIFNELDSRYQAIVPYHDNENRLKTKIESVEKHIGEVSK